MLTRHRAKFVLVKQNSVIISTLLKQFYQRQNARYLRQNFIQDRQNVIHLRENGIHHITSKR